jgi:hypothetical protein
MAFLKLLMLSLFARLAALRETEVRSCFSTLLRMNQKGSRMLKWGLAFIERQLLLFSQIPPFSSPIISYESNSTQNGKNILPRRHEDTKYGLNPIIKTVS